MQVEEVNIITMDKLVEPIRAEVKIRYKDTGAPATISPLNDTEVEVKFDQPRRAVTPGPGSGVLRWRYRRRGWLD